MNDEIKSLLILITLLLTVPVAAVVAFLAVIIADIKRHD